MWLDRLRAVGRELGKGFLHLLYPGCCLLCGQTLPTGEAQFCGACRSALFTDPFPTCPRCAATVGPHAAVDDGCVQCRSEHLPYAAALRLGPYAGVLREAVLRLKRSSGEGLAELLGQLWAEQAADRFRTLQIDAVVAVPLHWRRRWRRGYNQSAALAFGLAGRLRIPSHPSWLRRVRHTPVQPSQTIAGRKENVRGAFRARDGLRFDGKSLLLVDDVMTTGATVGEAARALRAAGAARVAVAVLARAHL